MTKLYGTTLQGMACTGSREASDKRADLIESLGMNICRLHYVNKPHIDGGMWPFGRKWNSPMGLSAWGNFEYLAKA